MDHQNGAVNELSRDEIVRRLEQGAQQVLGISAEEMVRRYRQGELEDPGEVIEFLILASLLAKDDPLFAPA